MTKRTIYLAGGLVVALMIAGAAHATNSSGNVTNNYDQRDYGGNTTNAGGTGYGGQGGNGGTGIGGAGGSVLGSGNSSNANTNLNSATAAQAQGQLQGQQQGQGQAQGQQATGGAASATGGNAAAAAGNASAAGGNGAGNVTNVDASSDYKAAASTAYAPPVPTVLRSCRLYISLGGSSVSGAGSGGIPIGNDATCLADSQIELMTKVNKSFAGKFTEADFIIAACKVEGMADMAVCKK